MSGSDSDSDAMRVAFTALQDALEAQLRSLKPNLDLSESSESSSITLSTSTSSTDTQLNLLFEAAECEVKKYQRKDLRKYCEGMRTLHDKMVNYFGVFNKYAASASTLADEQFHSDELKDFIAKIRKLPTVLSRGASEGESPVDQHQSNELSNSWIRVPIPSEYVQFLQQLTFFSEDIRARVQELITRLTNQSPENFSDYLDICTLEMELEEILNEAIIATSGDLSQAERTNGISSSSSTTSLSTISTDDTQQAALNLRTFVKASAKRCKLGFMRSAKLSPRPSIRLYEDSTRTPDEISKRFRALSFQFHPQRVSRWLFLGDELTLAEDVFNICNTLKENFLKSIDSKVQDVGSDVTFHEERAAQYWKTSLDFRRARDGEWSQLSRVFADEVRHLRYEELNTRRVKMADAALAEYRCCCKIADAAGNLSKRLDHRRNIALCLYVIGEHMNAQVAILAALQLCMQHGGELSLDELNSTKRIWSKVRSGNAKITPVPKSDAADEDESSKMLITISQSEVPSAQAATSMKWKINEKLGELARQLFLPSDSSVIESSTSPSQIKAGEHDAETKLFAGKAVAATGVVIGGAGMAVAAFQISSVAAASGTGITGLVGAGALGLAAAPIIGVLAGVSAIGLGLWMGYKLYNRGNDISREPAKRAALNDLMEKSLKFVSERNYQAFIHEMGKPYLEGCPPLLVYPPPNAHQCFKLNAESIINTLHAHAFRPDGIAYLLNVIGEALMSNVKVPGPDMTELEINAEAMSAFTATLHHDLIKWATSLDQRVEEIRVNSITGRLNRVTDAFLMRDESKLADEHLANEHLSAAQHMPFIARLREMQHVASLNLAVINIVNGQPLAIKRARELVQKVHTEVHSQYAFVSKAKSRLDVLEDFLWIISGEQIRETPEPVSQTLPAPSADLSILAFYDASLKSATTAIERASILNKKATLYVEAAGCERNQLESFRYLEQAQVYYQQSVIAHPKAGNEGAFLGRAKCLNQLHKPSDAQLFLSDKATAQLLRSYGEYWLQLGIAHRKQRNYSLAVEYLVESLKHGGGAEAETNLHIARGMQKFKASEFVDHYKSAASTIQVEEDFYVRHCRQSTKKMKIFSIDGGGIRGVIPAIVLSEIERECRRPISHLFHMGAGTSTGGIIAAGLTLPKSRLERKEDKLHSDGGYEFVAYSKWNPAFSAADTVRLYKDHANTIFSGAVGGLSSIWRSLARTINTTYTDHGRKSTFEKFFQNARLSHALQEILIPAVPINPAASVTTTFTRFGAHKTDDRNYRLVDCLMATSAAPTFFDSYSVDGCAYVDGGVQMNSPALAAVNHAKFHLGIDEKNIFVLSLGTGSYIPDPLAPGKHQGEIFWVQNIHNVVMSAQEGNTDVALLHMGERYCRVQTWMDKPIKLDAHTPADIDLLIEMGHQLVEEMRANGKWDQIMKNIRPA